MKKISKLIFIVLSFFLFANMLPLTFMANEPEPILEEIAVSIDETKINKAEELAYFLDENLLVEEGELVLYDAYILDSEDYLNTKKTIMLLNQESKKHDKVFTYDENGDIILVDKYPQITPFAFTNSYWYGYTTSYTARDCSRISNVLTIAAGASGLIALFSSGTIVGVPAGVFWGAASAILTISAGLWGLGASGNGVDISYDWDGRVFWYSINW